MGNLKEQYKTVRRLKKSISSKKDEEAETAKGLTLGSLDPLSQASVIFATAYRPAVRRIAAKYGLTVSRPCLTDEGRACLVVYGQSFSTREIAGNEIEGWFKSKNVRVRKHTGAGDVRFLL